MHELAIAESIIASVRRQVERHGYGRIEAVGVTIGELSDIAPEALSFAFEVITRDTELCRTRLEIIHAPVEAVCQLCKKTFRVADLAFACPECHTGDVRVTGGDELHIAYLDVE